MDKINPDQLERLRLNKESGHTYRERRHDDWDETYSLYRGVVKTNRLIQRQSVNIPLMKMVVRTILKDIDDMPVLYFENLDNDKQAELFKNEYWKYTAEQNYMELQDIIDKKQVILFGRSFDQWQIVDGKVRMTVQDPMDMLVDRYSDPHDLNTSRFLIHTHIFKPLSYLENNPMYDQEAVRRLKKWYSTETGIIKASANTQMLTEKNQKMRNMGLDDVETPTVGETIVELTIHQVMEREKGEKEEQIVMYVEADDQETLMRKPLEQIIGKTKDNYWRYNYNYNSWAEDLERQDFWSDSIGDIVRQSNKVVNAWYSQLVENRTLRNFGMHYYDATIEGFTPGSFNPMPWGWYGVPGKPQEVLQKVDIPDLSESLDEMQFVIQTMEKATGATATQQGVQTERQVTLGEVQLALGEAKERIKGMSKFYTSAWKKRGEMFVKLLEAGKDKLDGVRIAKKGRNSDNIFTREITAKDWVTETGYQCRIWSQEEKNTRDVNSLQVLSATLNTMPNNTKLREVYQRKLLEQADLTPEEINEIMEQESKNNQMMKTQTEAIGGVSTQVAPPSPAPLAPMQQNVR